MQRGRAWMVRLLCASPYGYAALVLCALVVGAYQLGRCHAGAASVIIEAPTSSAQPAIVRAVVAEPPLPPPLPPPPPVPDLQQLRAMEPGAEQTIRVPDALSAALAFSIATVPRPLAANDPHALDVERNSVRSWLAGGATHVLWLTERGATHGLDQLGLGADAARVRHVPTLRLDRNIPLVSSVFKEADAAATTPFVVFTNSDILTLPSFGRVLQGFLAAARDEQRFLLSGHRVQLTEKDAAAVGATVARGEDEMRRQWVRDAHGNNPYAMDVFVWRKGAMQSVPIPDFLIGRYVWDSWLWSYVVREWKAIQGAGVLFVFHQSHDKPNLNASDFDINSARLVAAATRNGHGVECQRLECAHFFLYKGRCRDVSASFTPDQKPFFCLRRKNRPWTMTSQEDDPKVAMSVLY